MSFVQYAGSIAASAVDGVHQLRDDSLVIDGRGLIVRCSPAVTHLLGWPDGALRGLSVTAIIPELPFALNTPGYNLAYAVFHATEGVWVRRTAVSADGQKVPLDIALAKVTVDGKPCIALNLREPFHVTPPGTTTRVQRDHGLAGQPTLNPAT